MKPKHEWTFSERQAHARGMLDGLVVGALIAVNIPITLYLILR